VGHGSARLVALLIDYRRYCGLPLVDSFGTAQEPRPTKQELPLLAPKLITDYFGAASDDVPLPRVLNPATRL
jgi:hypothetical protein